MLQTDSFSVNFSTTVGYVDTSPGIQDFQTADIENLDEINALYVSSILAPNKTQRSSTDTWGNIKIPSLEALGEADSDGWSTVSDTRPNQTVYSSMLGVPSTKMLETANTQFVIESTYFALDCSSLTKGRWPHFVKSGNASFIAPTDTLYMAWRYKEPTQAHPQWTANLSFGSRYSTEGGPLGSFAECQVTRPYVESLVKCEMESCAVMKIRQSRKPDGMILNQTSIPIDDSMLINYLYHFQLASGIPHAGQPTITERYLLDPETPFIQEDKFFLPIADLPIKVLTQRLALLLTHTGWLVSPPHIKPVGCQMTFDLQRNGILHR